MTYPKQNTQVIIKQQQNVASRSLDEQLTQAKQAFSEAKHRLVKPRFIAPSSASCMAMIRPRERDYFDNMTHDRDVLPRNHGQQCQAMRKIIAGMFPVSRGGAV